MGIFIRTLIITLIICLAYFFYAFVGKESYSPNLDPTGFSSIHTTVQNKQDEIKITEVTIYFMNADNKPVKIKRTAKENSLEFALKELFAGTKRQDSLDGLYSEIPKGTKLLSFKEDTEKIAINVSDEFEMGGGAQSIQVRLLQLIKTINAYTKNKPVYLYIEGKKIEYLGGEGIYVEQPLNEDALRF